MMNLQGCPRCDGAVVEYSRPDIDNAMCVNCGWRRQDIPPDVQEAVEAYLGKAYLEDRGSHSRIGTGKPPLSGWDRVKRKRQRELRNASAAGQASSAVAT